MALSWPMSHGPKTLEKQQAGSFCSLSYFTICVHVCVSRELSMVGKERSLLCSEPWCWASAEVRSSQIWHWQMSCLFLWAEESNRNFAIFFFFWYDFCRVLLRDDKLMSCPAFYSLFLPTLFPKPDTLCHVGYFEKAFPFSSSFS